MNINGSGTAGDTRFEYSACPWELQQGVSQDEMSAEACKTHGPEESLVEVLKKPTEYSRCQDLGSTKQLTLGTKHRNAQRTERKESCITVVRASRK
jgi:hypothetical protein